MSIKKEERHISPTPTLSEGVSYVKYDETDSAQVISLSGEKINMDISEPINRWEIERDKRFKQKTKEMDWLFQKKQDEPKNVPSSKKHVGNKKPIPYYTRRMEGISIGQVKSAADDIAGRNNKILFPMLLFVLLEYNNATLADVQDLCILPVTDIIEMFLSLPDLHPAKRKFLTLLNSMNQENMKENLIKQCMEIDRKIGTSKTAERVYVRTFILSAKKTPSSKSDFQKTIKAGD